MWYLTNLYLSHQNATSSYQIHSLRNILNCFNVNYKMSIKESISFCLFHCVCVLPSLTITVPHLFLSIGGKTYFIAVGDSPLIYVSSDGGVSWASTAKVQGNLEGVFRRHRYRCYALEYTTLKYCAPSNEVPPTLFFFSFYLSFFISFFISFFLHYLFFFLYFFLYFFSYSISVFIYSFICFFIFLFLSFRFVPGVSFDRAGNAFAVGFGDSGGVYYSSLSSAYTTWTPVSFPGK